MAALALATLSTLLAAAVSFTRPLYLDLSHYPQRWSLANVDGGCATLCYVDDGKLPVLKASVRPAGWLASRQQTVAVEEGFVRMDERSAEIAELLAREDRRRMRLGGSEQDLADWQGVKEHRAAVTARLDSTIRRVRRRIARPVLEVAVSNSVFGFFISMNSKPVPEVVVRFPLWLPVVVFAFLPIRAFIRGPIARRRLRRRHDLGQCMGCGYDLTGNVSGICPECGAAIPKPDAPPDAPPRPSA